MNNVPVFQPFRGLRYRDHEDLTAVAAPPYDVIQAAERDALAARDPHNAVQLILPQASEHGDGYATAAALLKDWRAGGVLAVDDEPAFYGYRMAFTDPEGAHRVTHGILGALELPADGPGTGDILPHERTISRHRSDRLSLLQATRANLDPIWGLSGAAGLAALAGEPGADARSAIDDAGVHHDAWPITDPARIDAIRAPSDPVLWSWPTATTASRQPAPIAPSEPTTPAPTRSWPWSWSSPESELWVAPIHRLVHEVVDTGETLRHHLEQAFVVTPAGPNTPDGVHALEAEMARVGGIGFVDADGLAVLVARPEVVTPALEVEPPEVRAVDAAVFEVAVMPRLDGARLDYRDDAGDRRRHRRPRRSRRRVPAAPGQRGPDPRRRPTRACGCRRRPRSSRRSRGPVSCSAPSTTDAPTESASARYSTVQVAPESSSLARSPGPWRSDAATSWCCTATS